MEGSKGASAGACCARAGVGVPGFGISRGGFGRRFPSVSGGEGTERRASGQGQRRVLQGNAGAPPIRLKADGRPRGGASSHRCVSEGFGVHKGVQDDERWFDVGLRPAHLRFFLGAASHVDVLYRFTDVVNKLLTGSLPEKTQKYVGGANLTALLKKDGGLRPIACGDV